VRHVPLDLDRILATPVTDETVGAPPGAVTSIGAAGAQGWTLDDLTPPAVILRASALEHNLALMARYCREHGVDLFPHGKTTMAPQLWQRQLDAGAAGLTAATPGQARAMRAVGVPRVLLANEVLDPPSIAWLAGVSDPAFDLACWVDSTEGVRALDAGLDSRSARLGVLVELGHEGGRTGVRSVEEAIGVAEAVDAASSLSLVGVAGYEGTIGQDRRPEILADVDAFLDRMRELTARLAGTGMLGDEAIVSAGGSLFFDRVVERLGGGWPDGRPVRLALRAGCTITHDHGMYERGSPFAGAPERFRPAIEAWGSVLSRPQPDVAVIGLGKRDVPTDVEPPIPLRVRGDDRPLVGMRVERVMDQHAICRVPADLPLAPGELVAFGISHPCTAFDRRRLLFVLDDEDRVVEAIGTMF
jgi:D-serine deaminase-like pyridoxal phosphate-dependent protein